MKNNNDTCGAITPEDEVPDLVQELDMLEQGAGYTVAWKMEHGDEEYPR